MIDTAIFIPPSIEEQEKIGQFLAEVDLNITLHQRNY